MSRYMSQSRGRRRALFQDSQEQDRGVGGCRWRGMENQKKIGKREVAFLKNPIVIIAVDVPYSNPDHILCPPLISGPVGLSRKLPKRWPAFDFCGNDPREDGTDCIGIFVRLASFIDRLEEAVDREQ
ncbi:hypothetical protein ElyMa_003007700 [Elysia marginata]|uniref:Uncharacterized protein n=1 Tax=Elysia marginata TaxID=1093978 RepID=A0AAV4IDT0_9GAST|nr:hypothetical protein ElyMa_003007700 [Elysia marginata]